MTAQHFMQNPGEDPVDISGHVLLPGVGEDGFSLQTHAESGSVAGSTVLFDDPDGTFYPIGLNAYRVYETDSDGDDPLLFSGGFAARKQMRGPYRTEGSRQVQATLEDGNAGLSRYVVRSDEEGNRPEETETERMEWLFTTSGMALHWDFATSILDLGATLMPKNDFTDSTLQQVLDDMAQQTGKNYYVFWDGSDGNPPEALLVYGHDSGTHLSSDLRFSNVETDHDGTTTFYAGLDWELNIDPSRIASYVVVRFANGRVDESDSETADEFSRIDRVMDGSYIKDSARATSRAFKYLDELDSEELILSGTVFLPASKASQFRAGMRVQMKATHLTGLGEFTWVRLVNVTCTQIATDEQPYGYALAFEATVASSSGVSCALVISDLDAVASGNISGTAPWGVTATADSGEGVMVVGIALGVNGTFAPGALTAHNGYTGLTSKPGEIGTHTQSVMAYKPDTGGNPAFTGNAVAPVVEGRQLSVWIPGGTFVQESTGIASDDLTWDDPLTAGNMVVLFRVAEGPTGFTADPSVDDGTPGVGWSLLADVPDALEAAGSSVDLWAHCVEGSETLQPSVAGSSWWVHAIEVSF